MSYNPRWPHTLKAFKPALDEWGMPVTDEDGNPVLSELTFERVIMDDDDNPVFDDGIMQTESVTELPWGYRTSTGGIKDSGEVFKADFKLSCPLILNAIAEGTKLALTDYTHTFEGIVKKVTSYNWGTNIWIDCPGNNVVPSAE